MKYIPDTETKADSLFKAENPLMLDDEEIHYGPCLSLNDVTYRPRKLKGIRVCLQKLGYRVDFVPEKWRDYCILTVCGYEVFRCNVRHLMFNTCVERDSVAQRAVAAVLDGTQSCMRARTYLWIQTMIFEAIFTRSEYAPKDHWAFEVDFAPFKFECKTCCGKLFVSDVEEETPPPSPPRTFSKQRMVKYIDKDLLKKKTHFFRFH